MFVYDFTLAMFFSRISFYSIFQPGFSSASSVVPLKLCLHFSSYQISTTAQGREREFDFEGEVQKSGFQTPETNSKVPKPRKDDLLVPEKMSKVTPQDILPTFATDGFEEVKATEEFRKETSTFEFSNEKFFATYWRPTGEVRALIFFCHGYAEYLSASYDEVAEILVKEGFLVFGHDHVGHGRSSGQRVQASSIADFVQPVLAHVKKVRRDFNDLPTFILGHSMGGLITINVLLAEQELFRGVVLMGPLVMMNPIVATPIKKCLASLFCRILPSFAIGELVPEDITRDKAVVQRVKDDPLNWHGGFRALLSYVLLQCTDALADGTALKKITTPALVIQGQLDKLVYPPGAQFFHDNVGSTDKKLVIHEQGFHNLYVELEDVKGLALKDTRDWLLQRL